MIKPGLGRISRLVAASPAPAWKAIHVAGTNGKGSICAYLSRMLRVVPGARIGRFTSPHIIEPRDCITINGKTVGRPVYAAATAQIAQLDAESKIEASPFEKLTATAFHIFSAENVQYGVVETGMGGTQDATNVLENKAVTIISKIGLDHQSFLGDTLWDIAEHKAGIMRPGVPCVVDASNPVPVLNTLKEHAERIGAELILASPSSAMVRELPKYGYEPHQLQNYACAHRAFELVCPTAATIPLKELQLRLLSPNGLPGRLQMIDIRRISKFRSPVLLDGAHNPQSAEVLGKIVNKRLRRHEEPVTWVLAASDGRDIEELLKPLLRPEDRVVAVEFGPVEDMPWVRPRDADSILNCAAALGISKRNLTNGGKDIFEALKTVTSGNPEGPLVIAGSLYLVGDVLRLLQSLPKVDFSLPKRSVKHW